MSKSSLDALLVCWGHFVLIILLISAVTTSLHSCLVVLKGSPVNGSLTSTGADLPSLMQPLAESCGQAEDSPSSLALSHPSKSTNSRPAPSHDDHPARAATDEEACGSVGTARYVASHFYSPHWVYEYTYLNPDVRQDDSASRVVCHLQGQPVRQADPVLQLCIRGGLAEPQPHQQPPASKQQSPAGWPCD